MKSNLKIFPCLFLICGVIGVEAEEVKSESVMEGDSVTLNSDLNQTQGINLILWRFGASGPVIAETVSGSEILYPHLTERFGGRLQLDHQTGSLTIKNMRIKHSGLYKLQINHNTGTSRMAFNVTVYDSPPVIDFKMKSIMGGDSVTLQTDVTETHGDELIVWRFGDEGKLIAKCDLEAKNPTLYETDERFRGRLKLDHQTGSLTITNTRTTDSELFTVKISSSSKQTSYKRFNVSVSEAATEGEALHFSSHVNEEERIGSVLSSGAVAGIVFLLVVVFAAGVFYYCCRISKKRRMVKTVSVMEGVDVTLKTKGAEIQNDDRIMWMHEENCIAERETRETYADGRFRDRLQMDEATGSLTITNIRTTDSGDYTLKIQSNSVVSYKKLHVIVTGSTGIRVNGSVTIEMPLMSREEGNGQPATTSLL